MLIFYRIDLYLVHVINDDIVSLVDGDVQVGDALDGVHDQVQVAPAMILGSPKKQKMDLLVENTHLDFIHNPRWDPNTRHPKLDIFEYQTFLGIWYTDHYVTRPFVWSSHIYKMLFSYLSIWIDS